MLKTLVLIITLLGLFLIFWQLFFLRNPKRIIPKNPKAIISPADGKVIKIIEIKGKDKLKIKKGLFGKITTFAKDVPNAHYLIVICMNVFNVHYQRVPIDGIVKNTLYQKGTFCNAVLSADNMQATLENEHHEVVIKGKITVKVIQIAGFVARRISCFLKKGEKVKKGQYLGLINLGSQVCLITPKINLKIKQGQRVYAGKTIVGNLR